MEHAIVNLLRQLDSPASIIFCNTRDAVRHLQATLTERGFSAVYLSGELGQNERNQALQALRDGRARICVATDVAARGIDLPNLNLVIHADLPLNAEILQHRSGRTGRAGRKGVSVLVVPHSRRRKAERLIADARLKPQWMDPPTADEIRLLDRDRFLADPQFDEELTEEDRALGEILLARKEPADIAALLARRYRLGLPAPEELSEPEPMHPPRGDRDYKRDRTFAERSGRERQDFSREERPRGRRESFDREPESLGDAPDRVVFRMDVGRRQKADPKWLLPMICRRGNVNRKEIGTIRIFEETTEFEVARSAAEHFACTPGRRTRTTSASCPRATLRRTAAPGPKGARDSSATGRPRASPAIKSRAGRSRRRSEPTDDARPAPAERPEKRPFEKKTFEKKAFTADRPTRSPSARSLTTRAPTRAPSSRRVPASRIARNRGTETPRQPAISAYLLPLTVREKE